MTGRWKGRNKRAQLDMEERLVELTARIDQSLVDLEEHVRKKIGR